MYNEVDVFGPVLSRPRHPVRLLHDSDARTSRGVKEQCVDNQMSHPRLTDTSLSR